MKYSFLFVASLLFAFPIYQTINKKTIEINTPVVNFDFSFLSQNFQYTPPTTPDIQLNNNEEQKDYKMDKDIKMLAGF